MTKKIQAIRGMNDVLPETSSQWQWIENKLRFLLAQFFYQEIRTPILESTDLFIRSIGEVTDIVEKEMYTFADRNGDQLSLRPEGTAGCVRACVEHGVIYHREARLWYLGPMFRYERPQKGRYRQFHQCGVEAFGIATPDIDAELIAMTLQLWKELGIQEHVALQLNSLGSLESRQNYRSALVEYFSRYPSDLDEDSKRRLQTNPLRILDSKHPPLASIIQQAPSLLEFLSAECKQHFDSLCNLLSNAGVPFMVNPRLVRGLDYYNRTAFEWVTDSLGAQGTVCGGGRYDDLVRQLGGDPTPAIGFAIGLERLLELCAIAEVLPTSDTPHIYFMRMGEKAAVRGFNLVQQLRQALPHLRILMNCGEGSFKQQFKRADKSGAAVALVLGDDEVDQNTIAIKYLREDKPQHACAQSELVHFLGKLFSKV